VAPRFQMQVGDIATAYEIAARMSGVTRRRI
jgi:hypothetical protein